MHFGEPSAQGAIEAEHTVPVQNDESAVASFIACSMPLKHAAAVDVEQ